MLLIRYNKTAVRSITANNIGVRYAYKKTVLVNFTAMNKQD